jgi:DNA helicase II / ATP-dependent DNA helicase PcrA
MRWSPAAPRATRRQRPPRTRLDAYTVHPVDILAELNPEQQAAVQHLPAEGPLLVIAGAGTGKTLTLASRAAWLIQQGVAPNRLLLITFSRRAAADMARRAGQLLHAALRLPRGTPPPVLPWCGTFHSVAARLLREEASRIGLAPDFTVLDRADAQDLMALTRQSLGLADAGAGHPADGAPGGQRFPLAATCLAIHSRCVNTRTPLAEVLHTHYPWCASAHGGLAQLFAEFAHVKLQQQSLDFDDLLLAWSNMMQLPALAQRIVARFDHVLVDELQDVNRLQADLVQALRPDGRGLTGVGDDAQSIYAFRGADVRHILDFGQGFPLPVNRITLEQNYRSSQPILDASNAVIALAAEGFPKRLWSPRTTARLPRLCVVADDAAQARGVADEVLALREAGLLLRRQAVLFRANHHSLALELELARRNVPFVKYGGLRFMEAAHIKDVLAVLRWAGNPVSRLSALRAARLVPGMGPASVKRLLDHPGPLDSFKPPSSAAVPWQALCQLVTRLRSPEARWPDDLLAVVTWYAPHLQRLHADARVRQGDLEQLCRLAPGYGTRQNFLVELTLDPPEATSDEAVPPHRDEDYLVLSTMHSAKGQEWNAVHVLNVVDGCLPADMAAGSAAEIEEERRLLYVAMTRARDELTLWVPQRFYVTQQRAQGDRHVHAPLTRFIPPQLLPLFEQVRPLPADAGAASDEDGPALMNLGALLRRQQG